MADPRKALFIASRPIGFVEGKPVYASQDFILGLQHVTNLVGGAQGILPESIGGGAVYGIVYIGPAGGLVSTDAPIDGQVLIGDTGGAPVLATLTGTANQIGVTNGAGSITLSFDGPVQEVDGGTGLTTYTLGDILYSDAANSLAKLAGNTSSTKRYLSQTGTGAVSAAPAWDDAPVSGTWTPTLTNTTNIAASTAYAGQYLRVGNSVTCSGKVDIDPTAAGQVVLGISLPVASNFATDQQCCGTASAIAVASQSAGIHADTTNDRATMEWIAVDTANRTMYYTFTYQVI